MLNLECKVMFSALGGKVKRELVLYRHILWGDEKFSLLHHGRNASRAKSKVRLAGLERGVRVGIVS